MIRLFSGDLTCVTAEPCPCGRTYRRLPKGIYGRVDDMLIVRGVNVYPHTIESALALVPGLGAEYRVVVDRPDELDILRLEIESDDPQVAAEVSRHVKQVIGLTPVVAVHPLNTLETTEFKSRRVIDGRRDDNPRELASRS
jgi:phenylacetate-CoA ligase